MSVLLSHSMAPPSQGKIEQRAHSLLRFKAQLPTRVRAASLSLRSSLHSNQSSVAVRLTYFITRREYLLSHIQSARADIALRRMRGIIRGNQGQRSHLVPGWFCYSYMTQQIRAPRTRGTQAKWVSPGISGSYDGPIASRSWIQSAILTHTDFGKLISTFVYHIKYLSSLAKIWSRARSWTDHSTASEFRSRRLTARAGGFWCWVLRLLYFGSSCHCLRQSNSVLSSPRDVYQLHCEPAHQ